MPLVIADRVQETSTTAGTGTLTLAGAVAGYQSFAVVGNGNETYYTIVDPITNDWEVGLGTYTASGTTLSRTTVLASSNANALVPFAANSKSVFVTYPAGRAVYEDASLGVTLPANLNFTGTGNRITGDFSNGTVANRLMFQTSTVNGNTGISIIPNGTSFTSNLNIENNSSVGNNGFGQLLCNTVEFSISASIRGSGTYLPIIFNTGGSERMRIDTSGKVGIGTTSPSAPLDVVGSPGTLAEFRDGVAANFIVETSSNITTIGNQAGSSVLAFKSSNTERARIDSSGNFLITSEAALGYGTGSGGTVTQSTSKTTAVTLNKPTGRITMNNASMTPSTLSFNLANTFIGIGDVVAVSASGFTGPYRVTTNITSAGNCTITVQNNGATASDAVVINFAVIKVASA